MKILGTIKKGLEWVFRQLKKLPGFLWKGILWLGALLLPSAKNNVGKMLLTSVAILAAASRHCWWPSYTQELVLRICWGILCLNIFVDGRRGRLRRPAGTWQLPVAAAILAVVTGVSLYNRLGWSLPVTTAYFLWRFMPWDSPTGLGGTGSAGSTGTGLDPEALAEAIAVASAKAAAKAEAEVLALGGSMEAAKAAAEVAAQAAAQAVIEAEKEAKKVPYVPSHGTVLGKWYYGTIPVIRLPLIFVRYRLCNGVVYREVFGKIRDTEIFSNIKNWDIVPDGTTAAFLGCCSFRILPDKIGEKALEVWRNMPINFALDVDESLTRAKTK